MVQPSGKMPEAVQELPSCMYDQGCPAKGCLHTIPQSPVLIPDSENLFQPMGDLATFLYTTRPQVSRYVGSCLGLANQGGPRGGGRASKGGANSGSHVFEGSNRGQRFKPCSLVKPR